MVGKAIVSLGETAIEGEGAAECLHALGPQHIDLSVQRPGLVLKGPRLKRVSNYRNKYVAHKLSRTSAEKSGELPTPIYEDIDRLFLYSMVALRELSRSIYPLNSTPEDWLREARHAETLMLKACDLPPGSSLAVM